uniref:Uncharacterized protein n=1 Tax=Glossina brevipalpis TaxID=37001 RepID=A0A1A9WMG0_9MUSC
MLKKQLGLSCHLILNKILIILILYIRPPHKGVYLCKYVAIIRDVVEVLKSVDIVVVLRFFNLWLVAWCLSDNSVYMVLITVSDTTYNIFKNFLAPKEKSLCFLN